MPALASSPHYGVCLLACEQIDISCKKLTPDGSVLCLNIFFSLNDTLQEVLKDTFQS